MTMTTAQRRAYERLAGAVEDPTEKKGRARICLYGNSGVGKSVLAAQILNKIVPEGMGILHIDTSEGWVSFQNHPELNKRVKTIEFTTIEDVREIAAMIKGKVGIFEYIGGIILDEASSMTRIDTDRMFEKRTEGNDSELVPAWPDYNASLTRFRILLSELFDIDGMHVILTAHEDEVKGDKGVIVGSRPEFSPKISKRVKEPLHLVARLIAKNKKNPDGSVSYEREIQVHPIGKFEAKTRIASHLAKFDSEFAPAFIAKWLARGGKAEESPAVEIVEEVAVPATEEEAEETVPLPEKASPEKVDGTDTVTPEDTEDVDDLIQEVM